MYRVIIFLIFLIPLLINPVDSDSQPIYFPPLSGNEWDTISPASLKWCTDKIDSLLDFLESKNSKAFIVLKDGRIVIEHYFGTFTRDSIWYWASAGKTLTSFLTGIAQEENYVRISDSASAYLGSAWTFCPPGKERLIKIRNQLTMTSGLNDDVPDPYCTLPSCLLFFSDAGTRWAYHNAPYTLLDKVIENATGQNFNIYFSNKIRNKTGMNGIWLPSGYNNVYFSNARSMARFGLLILNKGIWNTDTLLHDTAYFNSMTNTSQNLNLSYGYLWWLNGKESFMLPESQFVFPGSWAPDAPRDMFAALGKNGQILNVVPGMNLIVLRMGNPQDSVLEITPFFNNQIWKKLNAVICNQASAEENIFNLKNFKLNQNYPNPFNPVTNIEFETTKPGFISLKVFDVLGKEVATIFNEMKNAGSHNVKFEGSNLPSGIYFYSLIIKGNIMDTKRMVLVK